MCKVKFTLRKTMKCIWRIYSMQMFEKNPCDKSHVRFRAYLFSFGSFLCFKNFCSPLNEEVYPFPHYPGNKNMNNEGQKQDYRDSLKMVQLPCPVKSIFLVLFLGKSAQIIKSDDQGILKAQIKTSMKIFIFITLFGPNRLIVYCKITIFTVFLFNIYIYISYI